MFRVCLGKSVPTVDYDCGMDLPCCSKTDAAAMLDTEYSFGKKQDRRGQEKGGAKRAALEEDGRTSILYTKLRSPEVDGNPLSSLQHICTYILESKRLSIQSY